MENEIKVSVCCIAYNHGKYIKKCLDSILNQETNFDYEVIIHDDCSQDDTSEIINEYQKKHDNVRAIIQKENVYSKGISPYREFAFKSAKGKYIAMCECDDYWCDSKKLQTQYDEMEKNSRASWCSHYVQCVEEDGSKTDTVIPKDFERENICSYNSYQTIEFFLNKGFQLSSYFVRKDLFEEYYTHTPVFVRIAPVEDEPMVRYMASKGDLIFIPKKMSCYRMNSVSGWTSKNSISGSAMYRHYKSMCNMIREYDKYTEHKYTDVISLDLVNKEWLMHMYNRNYRKMLNQKFYLLRKKMSLKNRMKLYIKAVIYKKK